jgi:hypothetical protein
MLKIAIFISESDVSTRFSLACYVSCCAFVYLPPLLFGRRSDCSGRDIWQRTAADKYSNVSATLTAVYVLQVCYIKNISTVTSHVEASLCQLESDK